MDDTNARVLYFAARQGQRVLVSGKGMKKLTPVGRVLLARCARINCLIGSIHALVLMACNTALGLACISCLIGSIHALVLLFL